MFVRDIFISEVFNERTGLFGEIVVLMGWGRRSRRSSTMLLRLVNRGRNDEVTSYMYCTVAICVLVLLETTGYRPAGVIGLPELWVRTYLCRGVVGGWSGTVEVITTPTIFTYLLLFLSLLHLTFIRTAGKQPNHVRKSLRPLRLPRQHLPFHNERRRLPIPRPNRTVHRPNRPHRQLRHRRIPFWRFARSQDDGDAQGKGGEGV